MEEGEGGVCEGETRLSAERYSHKLGGSQSCQPKVGGTEKRKKKRHRAERGSQFREKKISAASSPPAWVAGGESLDGVISSTMGCSLCTLQKPEEQYKLLYEVRQVL